jgi:[CysO sulfur-carrier protein]-thiocarboxylate-dependent cysteine synthase
LRFESQIDAIGDTPLVGLPNISPEGCRLYAKVEGQNPTGSVKDRIAREMILRAERDGLLAEDKVLLEPSSGNTGISMAMICRLKGLALEIVMPESVSMERRRMLEMYGAQVHLSPGEEGTNGAIRVAEEMAASNPKYLMLNQYENQANPAAHENGTAEEIIRDLPEVDTFVAGLGTGGTLTGIGHRLKRHNPDIKIVAAEPPAGDLVQGLRSLDDGYIPPILDARVIDRKYIVNSKQAFAMTRRLFEEEGVFAGISSGAAVYIALRAIEALGSKACVVLLADGGWKYLSTGVHTADPEQVEKDLEGQIWW